MPVGPAGDEVRGVDFAPGESQLAVARAAAGVLSQDPRPDPVSERTGPAPGGSDLWAKLGRAGILSLAIPAWLGGDGLGVMDVAAALTEVGRRAAPVPALATLMTGVLPVARWADGEPRRALLPAAAAGELILTAALRRFADRVIDPSRD